MPVTPLAELIEHHADALTQDALREVVMHPRTPSFRGVPRDELTVRIRALYRNLAAWIARPDDDAVRAAYENWGRIRFTQDVPLSEVVYAVMLAKERLRRRAPEQGLAELVDREPRVAEFFDRALYYVVRGYEMQAATPPPAARGVPA